MRILILLFCFLGIPILSQAQSILGEAFVCNNTCNTYFFEIPGGTPIGTQLQWEVLDGFGNPISFNLDPSGIAIEVCFPGFGAYIIRVIHENKVYELTVFVSEFSHVPMEMQKDNCGVIPESSSCFKVCVGEEVTFSMVGLIATEIQWGVFGPGVEIIEETLSSIRIKVGLIPGTYNISMFGQLESDRLCFFERSFCFEVLDVPKAGFSTNPAAGGDTITICSGQNVYFTNSSSALNISWTISNGYSSIERDISRKFDVPGLYKVRQFVSNTCDCEDEKSLFINVIDHPAPQIYCAATACLGDTLQYQTDADCEDYIWNISPNGTIVAGGTNTDAFVEVSWQTGGSGTVELSHACSNVCSDPGFELIPLIGEDNKIAGPTKICLNSSVSYRIDPHEGTVFNWTTSFGGIVESGQGSSAVSIKFGWKQVPAFLAVEYNNCHLGCVGRDTLWLEILENFETSGPDAICDGESAGWTAFSSSTPTLPAPGIWKLTNATDQLLYESSAPSAQFLLPIQPGPGIYKITNSQQGSDFCNLTFTQTLVIHALPVPLKPIVGRNTVCAGKDYSYKVSDPEQNLVYVWNVRDGSLDSVVHGNNIRWAWSGNAPMELRLHSYDPLTLCYSDTISMIINLIENQLITSNDVSCEFGRATFQVPLPAGEEVKWSFSDSSLVNVLGFPSDNSLKVKWLQTGDVTVTASFCAFTQNTLVNITGIYNPAITHPDTLCENQTVLINAPGSFKEYYWFNHGIFQSNSSSVTANPGEYLFLGVDENGCRSKSTFEIHSSPLPEINIYTNDPLGICPDIDTALLITVSELGGPYEFTWFHNDLPLSATGDTLKVSRTGIYYRLVTNIHSGCTKISNKIEFCEHCDPLTVCYFCPCDGGGSCDLSKAPLVVQVDPTAECDVFDLSVTNPTVINSTVRWLINDISGNRWVLSGNPLNYRFPRAGRVQMIVIGSYIDSFGDTITPCPASYIFVVPAIGNFEHEVGCLTDAATFENRTEIDASFSAIGFNWDFGDPASGSNNYSNLENPQHLYSAPGIFTVVLRVDVSAGCYVNSSAALNIRPLPDAGFTFRDSICTDTELEVLPNKTNALYYEWFFDMDNAPGVIMDAVNPALHGYPEPGIYSIGLKVTDVYGCEAFNTESVQVFGNPDPGLISSSLPLPACSAYPVTLSNSENNVTYAWSNGSTQKTTIAENAGDYQVTLTNQYGCSSKSEPFNVEYIRAPESSIVAIGEGKSAYAPDTLHICAGASVTLKAISADLGYIYSWVNGSDQRQVLFDDIQNSKLIAGTHTFYLKVTDPISNCERVSDSLFVNVVPAPTMPVIAADRPFPLCSGTEITLNVQNIESGINYGWSEGTVGPQIITRLAGKYNVIASNDFGCTSSSGFINISGPPQLSLVPDGCFQACDTAKICVPNIPGAQLTTWMMDGVAVSPPPVDMLNPNFTESGTYHAILRTLEGCEYETSALNYQIDSALGSLAGTIFVDFDGDGIFTPGDSLLGNQLIWINGQGVTDSIKTNTAGAFLFTNLPSGNYNIQMDSSSLLNQGFVIIQSSGTATIQYCDQRVEDLFVVLQKCSRDTTSLNFNICKSEPVEIDGTMWTFEKDSSFVLMVLDSVCPSWLAVEIRILDEQAETRISEQLCEGAVYMAGSTPVIRDSVFTVDYLNIAGCDSIVRYDIKFVPVSQEEVKLNVCPGQTVMFRDLTFERDTSFTYTINGTGAVCDSIFDIEVTMQPGFDADIVALPSCPNKMSGELQINGPPGLNVWLNGNSIGTEYNPRNLNAGMQTIRLEDLAGCYKDFSIEISRIEELKAQIPDVSIPCDGSASLEINLLLSDTSGVTMEWFNGPLGSIFEVNKPGIYSATVSNQCEQITIHGRAFRALDDASGNVFVPTAFSPNEDQINDIFKTYWPQNTVIESYLFEVFDRWGELQFRTTDPLNGWDGFGRNANEKTAVYVWKLDAVVYNCDLRIVIKDYGDVTLFR
ncbi:MAG: gliding motility-associated C-terminal domain-containing protein [Saprospiraceae bacterium]|nr:gliding motility-associated C-terminal domain-containing protein [Saprospiraceae bacterium]